MEYILPNLGIRCKRSLGLYKFIGVSVSMDSTVRDVIMLRMG